MKQKIWQLNLYILKQDPNEATVAELYASNVVQDVQLRRFVYFRLTHMTY